jgi:hypothetical protein
MPYRMNEERQQCVVAAFNAGCKPRAVANEVGVTAPFWTVTVDIALDSLQTHTGTQTWH